MSISETRDAKKYASIAEVAAAQCKQYTEDARNSPQYATEAKASAEAADASAQASSASAQESFQSATSASSAASSALASANNAAASAATAGSAAEAAVQGIYDSFASSDSGEGASLVKTDKNRTAQDKFNENITPADYQAVGDAISNDDIHFAALENDIVGKSINLAGKSYFVSVIPSGNNYYNGNWVVSKTVTITTSNGTESYTYNLYVVAGNGASANPLCVVERDARNNLSKISYKLNQTAGLQSICFDEPNKKIYGMYFDTTSGSERSVVTRFSMNDYYPTIASPDLTTLATSQLGHQGLSIEYVTNADPKLWGAGRYDASVYPLGHRQVIRFNASTNGAAISNVQTYTLFGSEFSITSNATMVSVSCDQRWLVATGRKTSRDFWIRVFDLHKLINGGPGDYSNQWAYQFNVDSDILADDAGNAFTPIQNVTSDGAFVYILAGNATLNAKKIHQYTIDGKRVGRNNTVSVGLTQAQSDGTAYEPEAIAFYKPSGQSIPTMSMLILTGNSASLNNYVYEMGSGPRIYSGSWTPTITNVTNVTSSTAFVCQYSRIDNIITFSGRVTIQTTATGSATIRMSLPVSIISSSLTQVQGAFNDQTTQGGRIQLDVTSGLMDLTYTSSVTANTAFGFSGTYRLMN